MVVTQKEFNEIRKEQFKMMMEMYSEGVEKD